MRFLSPLFTITICSIASLRILTAFSLQRLVHPYKRPSRGISRDHPLLFAKKFTPIEDVLSTKDRLDGIKFMNASQSLVSKNESDTLLFPEIEQLGIDEQALRKSPFGKVLFAALDIFFPILKEPNW